MQLKLVLIDSEQPRLQELGRVLRGANVVFALVDRIRYFQPPKGLDVVYLPLAAAEQWGSKPIIRSAQVLPTRAEDQAGGMPPYIVTGVCLHPSDPRGPIPETRLLLSATFDAIRKFNKHSGHILRVVGFWAENLLRGVEPDQLAAIMQEVIPELNETEAGGLTGL